MGAKYEKVVEVNKGAKAAPGYNKCYNRDTINHIGYHLFYPPE
jgi:hypothetical protein